MHLLVLHEHLRGGREADLCAELNRLGQASALDVADGGVGRDALDRLEVVGAGEGDCGGPGLGARGQGVIGEVLAVVHVRAGHGLLRVDVRLDKKLAVGGVVVGEHDGVEVQDVVLQNGARDAFEGGEALLVGADLFRNREEVVHHRAGVLHEHADHVLVAAAAGAHDVLADDLAEVILLDAVLERQVAVVGSDVLAVPVEDVGALRLEHDDLRASLRGGESGLRAGVARADNNNLGVDDLIGQNGGRDAQPVAGAGIAFDAPVLGDGGDEGLNRSGRAGASRAAGTTGTTGTSGAAHTAGALRSGCRFGCALGLGNDVVDGAAHRAGGQ